MWTWTYTADTKEHHIIEVKQPKARNQQANTFYLIEKYTGNGRASVTREGGAYVVRGFTAAGKHVAKGVRQLGAARKLARATAK
jgi:hypothetical protein